MAYFVLVPMGTPMNPGATHSMRGLIPLSQPVWSGSSVASIAEQWVMMRCWRGPAASMVNLGVVLLAVEMQ